MFRLTFTPRFAKQQRQFLALTQTPPLHLKPTIEAALHALENATEGAPQNLPFTPKELWIACLKTGKPIYLKAALASSFASFCATGSALIAVNLLNANNSYTTLLAFSVGYFALNTFSQFGNYVTNLLRAELSLTSQNTLTALISRKILHLSSASALKQSSGNLKVLITSDVQNVSEFLNNLIRNLIPSIISVLVMAPFLIHFSGEAGWVGLATLTLIIPVALALNKISSRYQTLAQARMDDHATLVGEWVKNIRLVRFLSWDHSFEVRLKDLIARFMKPAIKVHLLACVTFGLSTTWWMLTGASVLIFAKLFHYPLQVKGFFGSLWLLTFISGYFTHLPNTVRMLAMAIPSMKRISDFLQENEQEESFEKSSGSLPQTKPVKIIFDQVGFQYSNLPAQSRFSLENLSAEIRLHQKTAILGEVGSGKTTFLKLLCGEYPPTSGKIWVEFEDGARHSLWEKETHQRFREFLALVPQIPYVSSDKLATNISLSDSYEEADVLFSIQKAEMQDDISQFDEGIHQMIGESGVNLSGGQRQRLNLARAFHSKRKYLVLDDTLSAVDHLTEAALMENICEDEDRGILLVTHRLSEIKRLGYVLVFQNGKLIEEGRPEILGSRAGSAFTKALDAYSDG